MCNRRGFISTRAILALLVVCFILPIAVSVLTFCAKLNFSYDEINDEIALFELRRIMLISYDLKNNGDSLEFIYHNDDYSLRLINNRLVLEPGYQMFLDKVDSLFFIEENNAIYVEYFKNNTKYKTPIVKKRGIYLDEFSSDNDELTDFDDSDE